MPPNTVNSLNMQLLFKYKCGYNIPTNDFRTKFIPTI